jgi:hypothetical protein
VASFTAYFVLGEVLYPSQILGGMVVIAAVVLLQIGREKEGPSSAFEIRQRKGNSPPAVSNVTDKPNVNDREQVV